MRIAGMILLALGALQGAVAIALFVWLCFAPLSDDIGPWGATLTAGCGAFLFGVVGGIILSI